MHIMYYVYLTEYNTLHAHLQVCTVKPVEKSIRECVDIQGCMQDLDGEVSVYVHVYVQKF